MYLAIKELINNLPEQARQSMLYSMVGSLNARIIGMASRIVDAIKRDDSDVSTEIGNGFSVTQDRARAQAETGAVHNMFTDLVWLSRLREEYHAQLMLDTNQANPNLLSFGETLSFMTKGDVRQKHSDTELALIAEAFDCGITAEDLKRINTLDQLQQRAEMAAKSHDILALVHGIPTPWDMDLEYADEDDVFDRLSPDMQLALAHKVADALNSVRDKAMLAFMRRSRGASLSDIPLINAAMKEVAVAISNAEGRLPQERAAEITEQVTATHRAHVEEIAGNIRELANKAPTKRQRVKKADAAATA